MDKKNKDYLRAKQGLEALARQISASSIPLSESPEEKRKRLKFMLSGKWEGFDAFAKYYFEGLIDADFGWFHKEAFKGYVKDKNYEGVWEWARGHAKSVFLIMLTLYDKARNSVTPNTFRGLVLASQTEEMACELLGAIQMQLQHNERYALDFGVQYQHGDWSDGNFSTLDGCGFWAFGLGQNPAGIRKGAMRPTHSICDDCDSMRRAYNEETVAKDLAWVNGEFRGTRDTKYGMKSVYVNNRVHRRGLTAHMAGDVEEGDRVRSNIHHIKVYITEDPKTHEKLYLSAGGVPAWKERFTEQEVAATIEQMGEQAERQLYHNHIEKGHVFKREQIKFIDTLPLNKYEGLVSYADLSFKDTAKNDYKAIVLLGVIGRDYHILDVWLRQESIEAACTAHLRMAAKCPDHARHYYEANFIQNMHTDTYNDCARILRMDNVIREDKQKKSDKKGRIESLSPLFSYGAIFFCRKKQHDTDMKKLVEQLLGFPNGHDDGPDALHGGISYLRNMRAGGATITQAGKYDTSYSKRKQ